MQSTKRTKRPRARASIRSNYCPQCGYEYRAGIRECRDCGTQLMVRTLSPTSSYWSGPMPRWLGILTTLSLLGMIATCVLYIGFDIEELSQPYSDVIHLSIFGKAATMLIIQEMLNVICLFSVVAALLLTRFRILFTRAATIFIGGFVVVLLANIWLDVITRLFAHM